MPFLTNYYKKYIIKIPKSISVFYFKNKKLIIFRNKKRLKFLNIEYKLCFLFLKNKIYIFTTFCKVAYYQVKKLNCLKKTILSFLKQFVIEMEVVLYNKLKLVGIGYKILKTNYNKILLFKLGYSHSIYFKLNFKSFIFKSIKLFIIGNYYQKIMKILSIIRKFKIPEPYKGKGILYDAEKLKIKEGKKT